MYLCTFPDSLLCSCCRQKVRGAYTTLHQTVFVSASSTSKLKRTSFRKKRPELKLVLTSTTSTNEAGSDRNVPGPQSASGEIKSLNSDGGARSARTKSLYPSTNGHGSTLQPPKYMRGTSEETHRRGSIYTPRHGATRQLSLTYDRSKMKPPAEVSTVTAAPSPVAVVETDDRLLPGNGGDSYIPKITMSSASCSSMLARHYYRLNNMKLTVTFFINVMLLTFKVCVCVCAYIQARMCVCHCAVV